MQPLVLAVAVIANQAFATEPELKQFTEALSRADCRVANSIAAKSARKPLLLGIQHEVGQCVTASAEKALASYRESARQGDNEGRYAFFVLVGRLGAQNRQAVLSLWEEAWQYLTAAADAHHPSACRALADAYEYGFHVPKNAERSSHFRSCAS